MPRFHFHLVEGTSRLDDPEGMDLADPLAAKVAAHIQARDIVSHEVRERGEVLLARWIEISDEEDRLVERVHFGDIIRVIETEEAQT